MAIPYPRSQQTYGFQYNDEELLAEILQRLAMAFDPEQIYLFGSRAWGTPGEESDLDLMVIVPETELPPLQRMVQAQQSLWGIKVAIDVIVKTREEFDYYQDVYASLERQISDEGILIWALC